MTNKLKELSKAIYTEFEALRQIPQRSSGGQLVIYKEDEYFAKLTELEMLCGDIKLEIMKMEEAGHEKRRIA